MLYFLIPIFNEEADLSRLFDEFINSNFTSQFEIVAVNDGSTDGTLAIIKDYKSKLKINLIEHGTNQGMGLALSSGFAYILSRLKDGDIVITMDADGTQPLSLVNSMLEAASAGADVVVASRFISGAAEQGVSFFRMLMSHGASALLKVIWPIKNVTDYSSGYRAYSSSLIFRMNEQFKGKIVENKDFSATPELLLKSSLATDKFKEVPLDLKYNMKKGQSKMKVIKTIFSYITLLIKLTKQR